MASSSRAHRTLSAVLGAGVATASLCFAGPGRAVPVGTDLGAVPAGQAMHATVWLKRRDEAGFQAALRAIYDPASPRFHRWMTPAQYGAFMPDQASVAVVRDALAGLGVSVASVAADGRWIDVTGDAAGMQRAFGAPVHRFERDGVAFEAATARPAMGGAAGALVGAVTGLGTARIRPFSLRQTDQATGRPVALAVTKWGAKSGAQWGAQPGARAALASGGSGSPLNPYLTDDCYPGITVQRLYAAEGDVTFRGRREVNGYFSSGPGYGVCGYDAAQMRAHYKLTNAVSHGLDGTGQTIGIVVAYGSPFITSDVNTYSGIEGLPLLASGNFQIVAPLGIPLGYDSGWSFETTIDVTMAHAMAPGARIVLLPAPSAETGALIKTFAYAVEHQLADVVSMSFGAPEHGSDGSDEVPWGLVTAEAAAYGMGVTVSSGDSGDNGAGQTMGAPSSPADSAYVTSVGGTALGFPAAGGKRDVGWGWQSTFPNTNRLVKTKLQVGPGEAVGAGGGESVYFGKPFWQDALPGNGRQGPDISAIADPLTGADLVLTVNSNDELVQVVTVAGGTSVAAPVFAGISALANQLARGRIGQVAPLLPGLQGRPILDILPLTAADPKVTASLGGKPVTTPDVTADALALLPEGVSDIAQIFVVRPILSMTIFTYGLDTSLTTAAGWDNVTGYGEPNGAAFLSALAAAAKGGVP